MHILVVESSESAGGFIGSELDRLGFAFDRVEIEPDCVEALERTGYQLVFIDMEAPTVDSDRLVRVLRRRYPAAKVVSVSANDDPQAIGHALHSGAEAFLIKPVAGDTLVNVLQHAI